MGYFLKKSTTEDPSGDVLDRTQSTKLNKLLVVLMSRSKLTSAVGVMKKLRNKQEEGYCAGDWLLIF